MNAPHQTNVVVVATVSPNAKSGGGINTPENSSTTRRAPITPHNTKTPPHLQHRATNATTTATTSATTATASSTRISIVNNHNTQHQTTLVPHPQQFQYQVAGGTAVLVNAVPLAQQQQPQQQLAQTATTTTATAQQQLLVAPLPPPPPPLLLPPSVLSAAATSSAGITGGYLSQSNSHSKPQHNVANESNQPQHVYVQLADHRIIGNSQMNRRQSLDKAGTYFGCSNGNGLEFCAGWEQSYGGIMCTRKPSCHQFLFDSIVISYRIYMVYRSINRVYARKHRRGTDTTSQSHNTKVRSSKRESPSRRRVVCRLRRRRRRRSSVTVANPKHFAHALTTVSHERRVLPCNITVLYTCIMCICMSDDACCHLRTHFATCGKR